MLTLAAHLATCHCGTASGTHRNFQLTLALSARPAATRPRGRRRDLSAMQCQRDCRKLREDHTGLDQARTWSECSDPRDQSIRPSRCDDPLHPQPPRIHYWRTAAQLNTSCHRAAYLQGCHSPTNRSAHLRDQPTCNNSDIGSGWWHSQRSAAIFMEL